MLYLRCSTYAGTSLSVCTDCLAGKITASSGLTDAPIARLGRMQRPPVCPCAQTREAGKYDDSGGGADSCTECGLGKYSTAVAATAETTWVDCVAGKYADQTGYDQEADCTLCGVGRFALETDVAATSAGVCNSCGTGYSADAGTAGGTGQLVADYWQICYCDGGYGRDVRPSPLYDACVAGKYSIAPILYPNNACLDCPGGHTSRCSYRVQRMPQANGWTSFTLKLVLLTA